MIDWFPTIRHWNELPKAGLAASSAGPIDNRPQVDNLPHWALKMSKLQLTFCDFPDILTRRALLMRRVAAAQQQ